MNPWIESEKCLIDYMNQGEERINNENYMFSKDFDQYMIEHWKKRLKKASKIKIEDESNPIVYTEFCMEEIVGYKATFSFKDIRKIEIENIIKTINGVHG